MITTEQYLQDTFGISIAVARDFILSNYQNNLWAVYSVCKANGINNDMIADILQDMMYGLTGEMVSSFFLASGFDGNALGFNQETSNTLSVETGFTQEYLADKTFYAIYNWKDNENEPDNWTLVRESFYDTYHTFNKYFPPQK